MKITMEMTIAEVLRANPNTADIFRGMGMHCLSCPGATSESVEQAAMVHGHNPQELLDQLNAVAE